MENHNKPDNNVDPHLKAYYAAHEQVYHQPQVSYVTHEVAMEASMPPPALPEVAAVPAPQEAAPSLEATYVPPPSDTPIKSDTIWYLDRQVLYEYARLELVPKDRSAFSGYPPIKINHLALMAYTDLFRFFDQSEDEDMKIITDFEAKDLQMVADFVMDGLLPIPMASLLETGDVPDEIARPFFAFGIDLLDLGRNGGKAFVIKKVKKVKVKKETDYNDQLLSSCIKTELTVEGDDGAASYSMYDNESRDNYYDDDYDDDYRPKKNKYDRYALLSKLQSS